MRKSKKRHEKIVATLTLLLAFMMFSGFTMQDGFGYVYYDSKVDIHKDVQYNNVIGSNPAHGIEQAYFVTAGPNAAVKPYVFNGNRIGKTSMKDMVASLNSWGYKVIAGVNGDLYDTGSGTPKGVMIHEGKLLTTGYAPEKSIAFDQNGKAFTGHGAPTLSLTAQLLGTDGVTQENWETPIGFLNVPHGGGKSLHLYTSWQGSSTGVKEDSCEVIVDIAGISDLKIGNNVTGKVSSVLLNAKNTAIGANQVVLSCASDSPFHPYLSRMVVGSDVNISVSEGTSGLAAATEAIGAYHLLVENGNIITTGTNLNPRTCVGIKVDGSIILYVLDGRQKWTVSAGLGLTEVAKHMISLGCKTVFNMDGGGSSNIAVRRAGLDTLAGVVNSVSDKAQRKTANGLFFVYQGNGNKNIEHLHIYPAMTVMMPGSSVQLKAYGSDSEYESVMLSSLPAFSVSTEAGTIDSQGNFTAGNKEGTYDVLASAGNIVGKAAVQIVKDIMIIPSEKNLNVSIGATKDINVVAKFGTVTAISTDNLFKWECDPAVGTIDNNGIFKAGNRNASGNITVSYDTKKTVIPVTVGGATDTTFTDVIGHWAEYYIKDLAAKGVVNGISANAFAPDMKLTRSQFLALLAKSSGEAVAQTPKSNFKDVPAYEWYYNYVNWGSNAGIVKGTDKGFFLPDAVITREQMAVMLDKYMSYKVINISKGINIAFKDSNMISDWAKASVLKAVDAAVIAGKDGGRFDPLGSATRAEAATVIWKLNNTK